MIYAGVLLYLILGVMFFRKRVINRFFSLFLINIAIVILLLSYEPSVPNIAVSEMPGFNFYFIFILTLSPLFYLSITHEFQRQIKVLNYIGLSFFLLQISLIVLNVINFQNFFPANRVLSLIFNAPENGRVLNLFNSISLTLYHCFFSISGLYISATFNKSKKDLEKSLLFRLSIFFVIIIVISHLMEYFIPKQEPLITSSMFTVLIYALIVMLISRTSLLLESSREKYKSTKVSSQDYDEVIKRLEKKFMVDKVYKTPRLSLENLSTDIGTEPHILSQVINTHYNCNFNQLINKYRVDLACELLNGTEMKITDIAYETGFNSLSSFNAVFKKQKNISPSAFRKL